MEAKKKRKIVLEEMEEKEADERKEERGVAVRQGGEKEDWVPEFGEFDGKKYITNGALGFFVVLPLELVFHVLGFLDAEDLLSMGQTSKEICKWARDHRLWSALIKKRHFQAYIPQRCDVFAKLIVEEWDKPRSVIPGCSMPNCMKIYANHMRVKKNWESGTGQRDQVYIGFGVRSGLFSTYGTFHFAERQRLLQVDNFSDGHAIDTMGGYVNLANEEILDLSLWKDTMCKAMFSGKVRLLDLRERKQVASFYGVNRQPMKIVEHKGDIIVSVDRRQRVHFFDRRSGFKPFNTLLFQAEDLTCCALQKKDNLFILGSMHSLTRAFDWRVQTSQPVFTFQGTGSVCCMHKNRGKLATGTMEGSAYVYNLNDGSLMTTYRNHHTTPVYQICVNEHRLLVAQSDTFVLLGRRRTGAYSSLITDTRHRTQGTPIALFMDATGMFMAMNSGRILKYNFN